jgi:hypothetical protein
VDGSLVSGQTYTLDGRTYALGDSDMGVGGSTYRARGTLSVPEPLVITDPVVDHYYDVTYQPWTWSTDGDADDIGAFDLYSDIAGQLIGGIPGTLVNEGLDVIFEATSNTEEIKGHVYPDEGEFFVHARGRTGGHAWLDTRFQRELQLTANPNAQARLHFEGLLAGELNSIAEQSAASVLSEISIQGTGLEWAYSQGVNNGPILSLYEPINTWGSVSLLLV